MNFCTLCLQGFFWEGEVKQLKSKISGTSISYKDAENPLRGKRSFIFQVRLWHTPLKIKLMVLKLMVLPILANAVLGFHSKLLTKTWMPEMRKRRVDTTRMSLCDVKFPSWFSKMPPLPELKFFYMRLFKKFERIFYSQCVHVVFKTIPFDSTICC